MNFRRAVIWFTLVCFVTTQTSSLAGPHDEGVAAGQAANPVARGGITAQGAGAVVPGYTATPPERAYYRQPDLAAQGSARLNLCAAMPNDPVCQALTRCARLRQHAAARRHRRRSGGGGSARHRPQSVQRARRSGELLQRLHHHRQQPARRHRDTHLPAPRRGRQLPLHAVTDGGHRTQQQLHARRLVRARRLRAHRHRRAMPARPAGDGPAHARHPRRQSAGLLRREHERAGAVSRTRRGAPFGLGRVGGRQAL